MGKKQIIALWFLTLIIAVVLVGCSSAAMGTGAAYSATGEDEHAIEADNETVTYDNISVAKTGDDADFYGTN